MSSKCGAGLSRSCLPQAGSLAGIGGGHPTNGRCPCSLAATPQKLKVGRRGLHPCALQPAKLHAWARLSGGGGGSRLRRRPRGRGRPSKWGHTQGRLQGTAPSDTSQSHEGSLARARDACAAVLRGARQRRAEPPGWGGGLACRWRAPRTHTARRHAHARKLTATHAEQHAIPRHWHTGLIEGVSWNHTSVFGIFGGSRKGWALDAEAFRWLSLTPVRARPACAVLTWPRPCVAPGRACCSVGTARSTLRGRRLAGQPTGAA